MRCDHAPSGRHVCHPGLAMINLPTKFEVFVVTHYQDMKGNAKCTNFGGLWG